MNYMYAGTWLVIPAQSSQRIGLNVAQWNAYNNVYMTFWPDPNAIAPGSTFPQALGSEIHFSDFTIECAGPTKMDIWYFATFTNPNPFDTSIAIALNVIQ